MASRIGDVAIWMVRAAFACFTALRDKHSLDNRDVGPVGIIVLLSFIPFCVDALAMWEYLGESCCT